MHAPSSLKAIVVDDNVLVLMAACQMLEAAGFDCLDAHDGDQAWRLIEADPRMIVLLFSDIEMPGSLDGLALARRVVEAHPHIEVVLASGRVHPPAGELPGNTTFIAKPFSEDVVHEHLRQKLPDEKIPPPLKPA